jgi:hypothetical protein
MSFSSNSQGAAILAQSGLSKANIVGDSYNYPLGSEQSSVNQIKGKFTDAKNDFALTEFTVNDYDHQRLVNKVNTYEVDLSGVDNWHQAFRLANCLLAKYRDCDWFNSLETGIGKNNGVDNGEALLLEEGDLISASDDSGDLVNVITRIESFSIGSPESGWPVKIAKARKYFTAAHSDDVRQHNVPLPTVNRYFTTRPSILEMLNGPPVWDEDGLVAGFYAFSSYDSSVAGDYRGSSLYADYGDGYKKIAEFNAVATLGTCSTTLPTAAQGGWDRTSSLTISLFYGSLSSKTDAEMEGDARLNLAVVGNEYLRFQTVVDNGDGTLTLSNFIRATFGTNDTRMVHGADERFILLDGAETLVKIDPTRINQPFNYKAVTTNQDVADASAQSFTWDGGVLLPLAPDSLQSRTGNLFVYHMGWAHSSRLGRGMRSLSGVPLSEENETYEIEIYDGVTLGRSVTLKGDPIVPVGWVRTYVEASPGDFVPNRDGSFTTGTSFLSGKRAIAESVQTFVGDAFFETTIGATGNYLFKVGLINALIPFYAGQAFSPDFYLQGLTATSITAEGLTTATVAPGDRVSIRVRGTVVEYFLNYRGENSVPFYRSLKAYPTTVTQKIVIENPPDGELYAIGDPRVLMPVNSYRYVDEDAIEDFGSLPDAITVRVRQISAVVGPGPYREATFTL